MLRAYSTDKIDKMLFYLDTEISKRRLIDPVLAKMYLYILWSSKDRNDVIYRPKWTYAIKDFEKYLQFFKQFNLLHRYRSLSIFKPDRDLYEATNTSFTVMDPFDVAIILGISEKTPEFKDYYSED